MSYAVALIQFLEAHAPALTPVAIVACFVVAQVQLRRWRPFIVRHYAHTEAIAEKLGVSASEEAAQEKRADAELPHGMTAQEYLDALSTAAIERDSALSQLREARTLLEKLTGGPPAPPAVQA